MLNYTVNWPRDRLNNYDCIFYMYEYKWMCSVMLETF